MTWDRLTDSEAATFEASLRSCIGMKWRHMGRAGCGYGHQTGLDCIGLIIFGAIAISRPVADLESYGKAPDGQLEGRITAHLGEPVPGIGSRRIALVKIDGLVRHVVYLTDAGTMIHSRRGTGGGVVEHNLDAQHRASIVRSWQL